MTWSVDFTPEAEERLAELYRYIAKRASPTIALRYTKGVAAHCQTFPTFPHRGTLRDDIRPGLRITNYRKRTVIAFYADAGFIWIVGVFHGGQNYEAILRGDEFELDPAE